MAWRLIEVPEPEAQPDDLTDGELLGVSILLAQAIRSDGDVFHRAYGKVRPAVGLIEAREDRDDAGPGP